MAILFRLSVRMSYLYENIANVGHYVNVLDDGDAEGLVNSWYSDIFPIVKAQASEQLLFVSIEGVNLDDPTDWYNKTIQETGPRSGTDIAPFLAWGIRLEREDRSIRPGSKRIASILEEDLSEWGVLNPLVLPTYQAVAGAWASTCAEPFGALYSPIVLHRPTISDPTRRWTLVTDGSLTSLTTQNSRKVGR